MSRTRRGGAVLALLAGVLVLSACGEGGGGASGGAGGGSGTIKIGFMGDLTGENSGIVIPPRNGATMAIDAYNATNPPRKVELVEYDSQGNPDQAVPLVTKAIQDGIVGMIGPAFSGESKVADPVLEDGQVPNISASATNPGLARAGRKSFHRVVAPASAQGPALADFLVPATPARKP
jgi:branched-chain amino acid transport system substrate-binding protein